MEEIFAILDAEEWSNLIITIDVISVIVMVKKIDNLIDRIVKVLP